VIRRFGGLALLVGALAAIIAWILRRREAASVIRESYETAQEEAREQLSEWIQERGQETIEEPALGTEEAERRPREEMRGIIKESVRRSRGEA
jgi:C4-dicarboxylate-specific signal transduction histidine kinase